MSLVKVLEIVGARPNFMKIAPLHRELQNNKRFDPLLIHTGQHYDESMSKVFFDDLQLPEPDVFLGVGSGSHGYQTAQIMITLEKILIENTPDLVIVVGDVNSTLAAALTAAKLHIPVAHVEAGLRSFNRAMPEEINRQLTDALSDFLFVTEESGSINLRNEGIPEEKIFFVGNVMIDALMSFQPKAEQSKVLQTLGLEAETYALLTLHRPSNVDSSVSFDKVLQALEKIQWEIPIVFPIHPRTRKQIESLGLKNRFANLPFLILIEPLGYIDFLKLMMETKFVFTDSGGIQEETTFLHIPCITLRQETERPVTVDIGTNYIVGNNVELIAATARNIIDGNHKAGEIPPLWDGNTSRRIVSTLSEQLNMSYLKI